MQEIRLTEILAVAMALITLYNSWLSTRNSNRVNQESSARSIAQAEVVATKLDVLAEKLEKQDAKAEKRDARIDQIIQLQGCFDTRLTRTEASVEDLDRRVTVTEQRCEVRHSYHAGGTD